MMAYQFEEYLEYACEPRFSATHIAIVKAQSFQAMQLDAKFHGEKFHFTSNKIKHLTTLLNRGKQGST